MNIITSGKAILISDPPFNKPHLWIVLTDPQNKPERVVTVMVRTVTKFTDQTLILNKGSHPFIRHESSVHYSSARYFTVLWINTSIKTGKCKLLKDVYRKILKRIRDGLLKSPYTVNHIRDYCKNCF